METYKWDAEHCIPTVLWTLRWEVGGCGSADVLVRSGVASGSGVVKEFGAGDGFELAAGEPPALRELD